MISVFVSASDLEKMKAVFGNLSNVYLFGSRVRGTHKPFSDVDVCLWSAKPTDPVLLGNLREKLQNSDISLMVDLSDFYDLPEFIQIKFLDEKVNIHDAVPA